MSAGTLYVAIKGDTKPLLRALKQAKNASVTYGKEAKKAFKPVSSSLSFLKKQVLALGAAWVGIHGIRAVVRIADQYALLDSKLKLVTQDTREFNKVYSELFNISQETGTQLSTNIKQYANLALALQDSNVSSGELLQVFEDLNKSLIVAGANTAEINSFMLQFKQALGANKLAGDEFKGMLESNSYWAGEFAKALKTDINGLYRMKKAGELTRDVVLKAHKTMTVGIASDFSGLTKTIERAQNELKNAWEDVINHANRASGATTGIAGAISELATTITENKQTISDLIVLLVKLAEVTIDVTGKIFEFGEKTSAGLKAIWHWLTLNNLELDKLKVGGDLTKLDQVIDAAKQADKVEKLQKKLHDINETIDRLKSQKESSIVAETLLGVSPEQAEKNFEALLNVYRKQKKAVLVELDKLNMQTTTNAKKTVEEQKKVTSAIKETGDEIKKTATIQESAFEKSQKATRAKILQLNAIQNAKGIATDYWIIKDQLAAESTENLDKVMEETAFNLNDYFKQAFSSIQSTLADFIYNWEFSMDTILNIFKRMLAEMVAAWLMSGIAGIFSDKGFSGFSLGSFLGGLGGSEGGGFLGNLATSFGLNKLFGGSSGEGFFGKIGSGIKGLFSGSSSGAIGAGNLGKMTQMGPNISSGSGFGSMASIGPGLFAGVAAAVGLGIMSNLANRKPSPGTSLTSAGVTGGDISTIVGSELSAMNEQLLSLAPALHNFTQAMYDTQTATLIATTSQGALNNGLYSSATLFDENTNSWKDLTWQMVAAENEIRDLQESTGNLTASMIQRIAAENGVASASDALIEKYLGITMVSEVATTFLGTFADSIGNVANQASSWVSAISGGGGNYVHGFTRPIGQMHDGGWVPRTGSYVLQRGEYVEPAKKANNKQTSVVNFNLGTKVLESYVIDWVERTIRKRDKRNVTGPAYAL